MAKNRQDRETILQMAYRAFPEKKVKTIRELTEGMCNAAYLIEFEDDSRSVLKIACTDDGLMRHEINMMEAEVRAMRIVHERKAARVAEVQYYDTTHSLCDGNYFFMEALPGESFQVLGGDMDEAQKSLINYETGCIARNLTQIRGDRFGLLGEQALPSGHFFDRLFPFVWWLMENVLADARDKQVELGIPETELLELLKQDEILFDQVETPTLVHWDMWNGNIFVKDGHISGIIDWERAMWGEAYQDDRFRRHTRTADFLRGFGKEDLAAEEMRRICWYDIYLYLTMMTEGSFRGYEDDGQYRWARSLLHESWNEIMNYEKKS